MASTFSTNLHLELQGTGEHSGTWGSVLNTNALNIVDQCLGGVQTFSLSNIPVTVSTSQSQNNTFKFTGTLTGNVTVTWPAIGRTLFVVNNTTGAFTVTIACAGAGTSAIIAQGQSGFFVLDAVNVLPLSVGTGPLSNLAGATTTDLGTISSQNINVTGTIWTATAFGSTASTSQPIFYLTFAGTGGILTHNATTLILPGAANITVSIGDTAVAMYLGSGNWRVIWYNRAAQPPTVGYKYTGSQIFTGSGTYTPTAGTRYIRARLWGGGGGGGGAAASSGGCSSGGGGGSGAYTEYATTVPAAQTITIGAGGTAGTSAGTSGGTGGQTSLGGLATAPGGLGGTGVNVAGVGNTAHVGGAGGAAGIGTTSFAGQAGGSALSIKDSANNSAGFGGNGGGLGGGVGATAISSGSSSSNGTAGRSYGGGGGGGVSLNVSSANGGAGFAGYMIIDEYD